MVFLVAANLIQVVHALRLYLIVNQVNLKHALVFLNVLKIVLKTKFIL